MAALQRAGCEVIYRRQTLRELGLPRYWYALRMISSAFWVYRGAALVLRERTRAAFDARSRVNTILVNRHAAYGIAAEKIAVVGAGPGLDVDIERDGGNKDPSGRTILFVGKLAAVKGLAVLLQAFALVRASYPDAVLYVVTGKPVAAPGVVFHGKLAERELKELFYRSNVFAMPAFKEPLGLVFLEAMWSKCACVGTTTGSMPEIIEEGAAGSLVAPGDPRALAEALMGLLADPAATRAMGERGYAAATQYWNWDAVVERMLGTMRG
jgi:glycosyltransferase involved in cell wall biosynthesis